MAMTVVRFTWNPAKAEANRRKHGVHFKDAARVFQDPLHLTVQDRIEDGEYRWQTIGQIHGVVVLLVAHTVNESRDAGDVEIRVISARKATRSERKRYEDESR